MKLKNSNSIKFKSYCGSLSIQIGTEMRENNFNQHEIGEVRLHKDELKRLIKKLNKHLKKNGIKLV